MIARLRGIAQEVLPVGVIVDVGGVGYLVQMGPRGLSEIVLGSELNLAIYTQVKEDALNLYGFGSPAERAAFESLLTVNGVGPKLALAALDGLGLNPLAAAIEKDDTRALCSVSGVGRKTAQRMCLELKGKLIPSFTPDSSGGPAPTMVPGPQDALPLALARLGYKKSEIDRAISGIEAGGFDTEAALQDRLSAALRVLSGRPA